MSGLFSAQTNPNKLPGLLIKPIKILALEVPIQFTRNKKTSYQRRHVPPYSFRSPASTAVLALTRATSKEDRNCMLTSAARPPAFNWGNLRTLGAPSWF